ncbi:hypothetical protein [Shewanella mesophila]|uniref:hypothetical protein n=1 Tax=Shewanella mesophila TaxID=2864208 RepID=UPI003D9C9E73
MAQGVRVNQVARELEFASDSAFIAFFKQYLDLPLGNLLGRIRVRLLNNTNQYKEVYAQLI